MIEEISKEQLQERLEKKLQLDYNSTPAEASEKQIYKALSSVIVELLRHKRQQFMNDAHSRGRKQVYYLSMEFLMGRSLKTSLYNLGIINYVEKILKEYDVKIERVFEYEPDAGLGNGGLGRLAACYLDALATDGYPAMGYSICYEYGIFKQKMEDGWQTELPDNWLPGGDVWLTPKPAKAIEIRFDGEFNEYWTDDGCHKLDYKNYTTVMAVPNDMYVSGYNTKGVSVLRLWTAKIPAFDMAMFNQGDYAQAMGQNNIAQAISKVLYPNDNHLEGKSLRLRQQYFLCAASIADIVNHHMSVY
ncbi:MAG: glycogen/starch/alpha-glucan phosphorylase, partial [Oscillospiraceae bacterium]